MQHCDVPPQIHLATIPTHVADLVLCTF